MRQRPRERKRLDNHRNRNHRRKNSRECAVAAQDPHQRNPWPVRAPHGQWPLAGDFRDNQLVAASAGSSTPLMRLRNTQYVHAWYSSTIGVITSTTTVMMTSVECVEAAAVKVRLVPDGPDETIALGNSVANSNTTAPHNGQRRQAEGQPVTMRTACRQHTDQRCSHNHGAERRNNPDRLCGNQRPHRERGNDTHGGKPQFCHDGIGTIADHPVRPQRQVCSAVQRKQQQGDQSAQDRVWMKQVPKRAGVRAIRADGLPPTILANATPHSSAGTALDTAMAMSHRRCQRTPSSLLRYSNAITRTINAMRMRNNAM